MIDAAIETPTHAITLTTRDPATTPAMYRDASRNVWRRLRRRYGRIEYYGRIEFTTGRARSSGGWRRMHGHYAVKGDRELMDASLVELRKIVRETWRHSLAKHGASFEAWRIDVDELRTPAGALHYLALHHAKAEQLPPEGWRGMAERPSQGYFIAPVSELRREARSQLWAERLAWQTGMSRDDARFLVDQQLAQWAADREAYREYRETSRWEPPPPELLADDDQELQPVLFGDDDIPF